LPDGPVARRIPLNEMAVLPPPHASMNYSRLYHSMVGPTSLSAPGLSSGQPCIPAAANTISSSLSLFDPAASFRVGAGKADVIRTSAGPGDHHGRGREWERERTRRREQEFARSRERDQEREPKPRYEQDRPDQHAGRRENADSPNQCVSIWRPEVPAHASMLRPPSQQHHPPLHKLQMASTRRVTELPANAKQQPSQAAAGATRSGECKPLLKSNGGSQPLALHVVEFGPSASTSPLILKTSLTAPKVCRRGCMHMRAQPLVQDMLTNLSCACIHAGASTATGVACYLPAYWRRYACRSYKNPPSRARFARCLRARGPGSTALSSSPNLTLALHIGTSTARQRPAPAISGVQFEESGGAAVPAPSRSLLIRKAPVEKDVLLASRPHFALTHLGGIPLRGGGAE